MERHVTNTPPAEAVPDANKTNTSHRRVSEDEDESAARVQRRHSSMR